MKSKIILILMLVALSNIANGEDTLRISFLYGSKPHPNFIATQNSWFGGINGGHVGIATSTDSIFHFLPDKEFHYRKHFNQRHSKFAMSNSSSFNYVFGKDVDSVKMLKILIPITSSQKKTIDSLHQVYLDSTPYDYAFIGMRCAAASYEVLSHIGLTKKKRLSKVVKQNFYPKPFRKRLVKKANKNGWLLVREKGSVKRIWEKD